MAPDGDAARIGLYHLEWQSVRDWLPIHLLDDDSDVDIVAGPVDTAIGKQVGLQRRRLALGVEAAGVESRQIKLSIVALVREEGKIAVALGDIHGRRLLALEILEGREGGASVGIGLAGENRQAVLSKHVDCHVSERLPRMNRLHKNVVAPVGRVLYHEPRSVSRIKRSSAADAWPITWGTGCVTTQGLLRRLYVPAVVGQLCTGVT